MGTTVNTELQGAGLMGRKRGVSGTLELDGCYGLWVLGIYWMLLGLAGRWVLSRGLRAQ